MSIAHFHREDIKAELRKRHETVGKFARARGIKQQAVTDWLRGRPSAAVAKVIAAEFGVAEVHLITESINVDDTADAPTSHRLNAEAR